jgi:hypothetical protein
MNLLRLTTLLIGWLLSEFLFSQCVGVQSFTLNPPPPPNGYAPGSVVNVCYTMQGWNGTSVQTNWLEGFDLNLGPGWVNLLTSDPPDNCDGGEGTWLWLNSTTSSLTGISVGPGFFFDLDDDMNAGDDWGDFGTTCTWSFCFTVTTSSSCTPQNLLIQVTAGADGTWGGWINNACPTIPFTIYNGSTNTQSLSPLGSILHN